MTIAQNFIQGLQRLPDAIKQMGFEKLREGQVTPINCIMACRDTFCILPTSGGKSAIFAIPTIAMEWHTVVFSPLVALMRDQVQSMNLKGIRSGCVNSSQTEAQNWLTLRDWSEGSLQLIYVAPERVNNPKFQMAMQAVPPDFIVLDEAHMLSQVVTSFRPAYRACGELVKQYNPKVIAAFTATATDEIVDDVKNVLHMENACVCRNYFARTNLHLSSKILDKNNDVFDEVAKIVSTIKGSIIVYCQTIKELVSMVGFLEERGEQVTFYHGQIHQQGVKEANMDAFMSNRARICVATNAFGMGIDKPDIECIVHTGPPNSVEAIAQETGRAARDGRDAYCYMFETPGSRFTQQFFWDMTFPDGESVRKAYQILKDRANNDGIVLITSEDLTSLVGCRSAEGALNYLQSCGCVERFTPEEQLYTFGDPLTPLDDLPKSLHGIVSCIRQFGSLIESREDRSIYKIDLNYLISKVGQTSGTVKGKITRLKKENIMTVEPPFRGKATRLIHAPTSDNISAADAKRSAEMMKIEQVAAYIRTPDDKKHDFISNYFNLKKQDVVK